MRTLTRRRWLAAIPAVGAASLAYPCYLEPRWLEMTRKPLAFFKEQGEAVRLLHLSDFHASVAVSLRYLERALDNALSFRPDVICLTGDFITAGYDADFERYRRVLARLAGDVPAFAVLGNHDGGPWAAARGGDGETGRVASLLESSGIRLLHNKAMLARVRGRYFNLVGLADLWSGQLDPRPFSAAAKDVPTVVMAHNPDSKEEIAAHPWNLMLAGHTHGGQVRIPLAGAAFAPVRDTRFVEGLKPWNGRWIHVTRGVGNLWGVRFRCRPEISLLVLGS